MDNKTRHRVADALCWASIVMMALSLILMLAMWFVMDWCK